MAETAEENDTRQGGAEEAPRRPQAHQNRIVWWVIVALIVIFVVAGALGGKKSTQTPSTINSGTRAVILPTNDAARTVIVPPCGTGTNITSTSPAKLINTTGTTSVVLPQGGGTRIVLVPRCGGRNGASGTTSNLPSAAFVTKPGTPIPPVKPGSQGQGSPKVANPASAEFQIDVPPDARIAVVPPCETTKPKGPVERFTAPAPGSHVVVAPAC